MTNWNKEPDEKKIYRLTKFFHKLDNNKCKYTRAHVQENKSIYLSIYLSIWKPFWKRGTRFQKGFHIERYILLFSCTCARVHFSFAIVQLVKNLGSTINFFFVGFFVPIWKEHVVWAFKSIRPAIKICNGELYDWFWEWGKQPAKQPGYAASPNW